jgi:site-specific recombinase XerD
MRLDQRFPLIQEAFDIFLLDAKSRRLTESTMTYYRQRVGRFILWTQQQGLSHINEISTNYIRRYLIHLQEKGLASQSQHTEASAVRAFLNFCVAEEWLDASPMQRVRMPKVDKNILSALEVEDVKKLLKVCETERDKAIILCLLDTGCRASEFVALNGSDIDLNIGSVRVFGKGRKERITYMGARSRKQLMRYFTIRGKPEMDEPIWVSEKGGTRLTYWGLQQLLKRLGDQAGVEECTPHTFRRTMALWSLRNRMSIYELQRLLGHSDIEVLRRYLALVEADLKSAHDRFGAVDNML